MFNKEHLIEIKDLKIAKRLAQMTQGQVDDYVRELNNFIDVFPRIETEIREALEKKDAGSLSEKMLALRDELTKISADDIADECGKNATGFSGEKFAKFEAYANFLLSQLAALSIDIQMVLFAEDEPAEEASADTEQPEEAAVETHKGKIILAVDDDPQCLDIFKLALKEIPCKIIAVTSGTTALNIIKTQTPDLFVFDVDMPDMSGLDLAKKVREAGHKAPVVFITGNAQKEIVMEALNSGASEFILKPINPQNVVVRISKFI